MMRFVIGQLFRQNTSLPLATLISNLIACMIFAFCVRFVFANAAGQPEWRLLLLTGLCGGLSTFSAFGFETFLLLKQEMFSIALANIFLNVALCVLIFFLFRN